MDTLKATCFQLQIIAACGLQRSAGNASAYSFPPSAPFRSFPALLTAALCSGEGFYQESHLKTEKWKGIADNRGSARCPVNRRCLLSPPSPWSAWQFRKEPKQLRAQAVPVIKAQNFNAAQWNTGLSGESLKNQRTQTPSAETQGETGDSVSSNHGRYFMFLIKVTQRTANVNYPSPLPSAVAMTLPSTFPNKNRSRPLVHWCLNSGWL